MNTPSKKSKQVTSQFGEPDLREISAFVFVSSVFDYKIFSIMSESSPKKRAVSSLDQLKSMTVVVADTGDFAGKC